MTGLPPIVVLARTTFESACLAIVSASAWIAAGVWPVNWAATIWILPSGSAAPATAAWAGLTPRPAPKSVSVFAAVLPVV